MHDAHQSGEPTGNRGVHASWLAIAVLGIGSFAFVTTEFLPIGVLPQVAADIGITDGQAGLMITGPGISAAISAPLSIAVTGRVDRRTLLCLCLAVVCVSNLATVAAGGFATILAARILMGAALGVFWTTAGSLGPRLRPGLQGAKATAVILSGIALGTVAGVPAGALIGASMGWRVPFVLTATLAGIVVVALLTLLPRIQGQRGSGLRAVSSVLRRPQALIAVGATLILFGGQTSAYTYISPYLQQNIGIDAEWLSVVLLGYGLAGFVGNLAGGWVASHSERGAVIVAACILAASVAMLVLIHAGFWFALLCVALWGFAYGMMPVALQTYTLSSAPDRLEAAAAILVTTIQIAISAGSSIGGFATDRLGVVTALRIGVAAAVLTAAMLLLAPRSVGPTTP